MLGGGSAAAVCCSPSGGVTEHAGAISSEALVGERDQPWMGTSTDTTLCCIACGGGAGEVRVNAALVGEACESCWSVHCCCCCML